MNKSTVSVVIPTLGGSQLESTIDALNRGTIRPDRIYICIPEEFKANVTFPIENNVHVIATTEKGQVAQRAVGLATADTDYVVQLDDDIIFETSCLECLLASMNKVSGMVAIAPAFINPATSESLYNIGKLTLAKQVYYWILNGSSGYQPGTITKAGTCFGINMTEQADPLVETEWLPGGCVIHMKNQVITENFFPFSGKAYSEDLFFSELARSRGIRLFINKNSQCFVEPMPAPEFMPVAVFFHNLAGDHRPRKSYVRKTGRSLPRMYCYYVFYILHYCITRFKVLVS